jgi:hypothetical protein
MDPLNPQLTDQFIDGGFAPVQYRGNLVYPDHWIDMDDGDSVRIEWLSSNSWRAQAVVLRLRLPDRTGRKGEGGLLEWGDLSAPSIRLWERSAGPVAHVRCVKRQAGARVLVTNAHDGPTGVNEGVGNSGMLIEPVDDDTVVLRCSDGLDEWPDFRNMVVRLEVHRGAKKS